MFAKLPSSSESVHLAYFHAGGVTASCSATAPELRSSFSPGRLCERTLRTGTLGHIVERALGIDGAALNASVVGRGIKAIDLKSDAFDLARATCITRLRSLAFGCLC